MANWWKAIPVDLSRTDLDCAWQLAQATAQKRDHNVHASYQASAFWTPFEIDQYGHICEHIAHRFTGEPLHSCEVTPSARSDQADVGPWEVKGVPWRSSVHFHLSEGGRIPVPGQVRRPILAVSYFLGQPERGWVDGWMPWREAIQFPLGGKVRGKSGQRAHMIPYAGLRTAQSICDPCIRR